MILEVFARELLQVFHFLLVRHSYVWSQVEVESRNSLTTVHLVLTGFQRDASQYGCCLNTLGWTAGTMASCETMLQDDVERMLYASQTLGRIIIFVVYMNVVVQDGVTNFLAEEVVVNEWFCSFRSKFHHHAGRSVGIHVGVFTGDVIVLGIHDAHEHIACLCLAGNVTLVAVCDVLLCHVLAGTLHELHLDGILDGFYAHLVLATIAYMISDFLNKSFIFTLVCVQHGFTYGSHDFLLIETNNASVTLYYSLYHF